jgi:hypothetical protein
LFNTVQAILALAGLAGVAVFAILRTFSRKHSAHRPPTGQLVVLFLGLSTWTALSIMRHDIVATVGLIAAKALFYRHYQALPGLHASTNQKGDPRQIDSPVKPSGPK